MSEIRQAILEAATWIEANPKDFQFTAVRIPHPCGSPGCALGWISAFAGFERTNFAGFTAALPLLGVRYADDFYGRMHKLSPWWGNWMFSPKACVKALRRYADKYHPAPKPAKRMRIKLPNWNALASEPLPVAERTAQV